MTWTYLDVADLIIVAEEVLGQQPVVREWGLLGSSAARPAAQFAGHEAYPTVWSKAAALLHSICMNHALLDGNNRLAWGAAMVFLGLNGVDFGPVDVDDAEEFVMAIAKGELVEVDDIAERLESLLT